MPDPEKFPVELEPVYWARILSLLHEQISTGQDVLKSEKTAIADDEFVRDNLVRPIHARAHIVDQLVDQGVLNEQSRQQFGMVAVERAKNKSTEDNHSG